MKYILALLSLFFCCTAKGSVINKVLIIDTVIGDITNFRVMVTKPMDSIASGNYENRFRAEVDLGKYPNVQITIQGDFPNSSVRLPLDDSGGYLSLENVFRIKSDTVRIRKLEIFHNCFPDSSFYTQTWYKTAYADSNQKYIKIKTIKRAGIIYKKADSTFGNRSILITINDECYIVPLALVRDHSCVTNYCHGHKTMGKWRTRRYEKREISGKPYKYFSGSIEVQIYVLRASIDLGGKR